MRGSSLGRRPGLRRGRGAARGRRHASRVAPPAPASDANWLITERPEFTRLFAGMAVCSREESFSLHHGMSSHAYSAFVPAMDKRKVVASFWKAAGELGFPRRDEGSYGFMAEDFSVVGSVQFPFVRLSVGRDDSALEAGFVRARAVGFVSVAALMELESDDGDIEILLHSRGRSLQASLAFPYARRPEIERWVVDHTRPPGADGRRNLLVEAAPASTFVTLRDDDGRTFVTLIETSGEGPTGDACPSRAAPPAEDPHVFTDPQVKLLEEMLGK